MRAAAASELARQQAVDEAAELSAQLAQLRVDLLNAKLQIADAELTGGGRGGDGRGRGAAADDDDDDDHVAPGGSGSVIGIGIPASSSALENGRNRSESDVAMMEKARCVKHQRLLLFAMPFPSL